MKQERLNSLMTIHVHKDKTDKLELKSHREWIYCSKCAKNKYIWHLFLTFLTHTYTFKLFFYP